jgi:hypothetical protein
MTENGVLDVDDSAQAALARAIRSRLKLADTLLAKVVALLA